MTTLITFNNTAVKDSSLNENHYTRRVSFNNLNSDDDINIDTTQPLYNNYTTTKPKSDEYHVSIPDMLTTSNAYYKPRKRFKLPDPPSKSILKNRVSQQQLEYNNLYDNIEDATINYHEEEEDEPLVSTPRRKSYSEMSNEELLALDPQFKKSNFDNLDKFKFDNQKTYYSDNRRSSVTTAPTLFKKQEYPTSNENNYKSINLTIKHDDYDTIKYSRTLLTIISGRKHSWNSIDWLLNINSKNDETFLIDGDYLIVSCLIPQQFIKEYNNKKKRKSTMTEYLYFKCHNLLNYLLDYMNKFNLKLKLTVEFVLDGDNKGNKFMIQHVFNQYQPNLIIIGNRSSNLNFKYKVKSSDEYLIKLSSYIVKYSTIPTILIGQQHENLTKKKVNKDVPKIKFTSDLSPNTTNNSSSSIESVESFIPKELTEEESKKIRYKQQLKELKSLPNTNEDKFQNLISLISDNSFSESTIYLSAVNSKDDSIKLDNKIHEIYKSQSFSSYNHNNSSDDLGDNNIYKVKSLISFEDEEEVKRKQQEKRRRSQQLKKSRGNSVSSNESDKNGKKSFWQKIGLKKS
ncbi:unnamed protein product [Candida verbasci]|uniref:Uncharacterized protein n=1 Tax=Candida verbasci TaxID=1227364 RepID=A0A9W4XI57_9ASCO|nr:unnamed protein product [Candida verbasci]